MKLKRLLPTAIVAFAASFAANATNLLLPPANEITVGVYGDFSVYSLDLLQKCAAAGDARCLPSGPYPVQSSPGQIHPELVIYRNSNGAPFSNYDNGTGPFPGLSPADVKVDSPFDAPTGAQTTFDMTAAGEPTTTWSDGPDIIGRWDASLSSVLSYLTHGTIRSDLVFLFDNNQQGTDLTQQQFIWAEIKILDSAGGAVTYPGGVAICYELNSHLNSSFLGHCDDTPGEPLFTAYNEPTDYVSTVGRFCVDYTTGAAYNQGASNQSACNPGDYFVSNNLGASWLLHVGRFQDARAERRW